MTRGYLWEHLAEDVLEEFASYQDHVPALGSVMPLWRAGALRVFRSSDSLESAWRGMRLEDERGAHLPAEYVKELRAWRRAAGGRAARVHHEDRAATPAERMRAVRDARAAVGACIQCGKASAVAGSLLCAPHRDAARERSKAAEAGRYERRKAKKLERLAEGKCVQCGEPAAPRSRYCFEHHVAATAANARHNARRRKHMANVTPGVG